MICENLLKCSTVLIYRPVAMWGERTEDQYVKRLAENFTLRDRLKVFTVKIKLQCIKITDMNKFLRERKKKIKKFLIAVKSKNLKERKAKQYQKV